jgi:hypothetical protein
MLAGSLPRLASAVLQPQVLAAGLVTGVGVGAVGVGTGAIPVTDVGPRITFVYECPDSNRVVERLTEGQSVLVTARTSNGAWLQVYVGTPDAERGWTKASSLQLPSPADALPVADCVPTVASPGPTGGNPEPSAVFGTPIANGPPVITDLIVGYPNAPEPGTETYVIGTPSHPCNGESQALIDVQVSDPDGVAYVGLAWDTPNGNSEDADMEHKDGNLWEAWITAEDNWGTGTIPYYVFARDSTGQSTTLQWSIDQQLELRAC